jgi:pimeloyl-ACP methyl ester carboxylesterase
MWEPVLPRFAALGWYAVAPDLLGHGASDPGCAFAPTLADYAAGVWAALNALHIEAFDVIGHHSGAAIGLLMATEQPQRVRALALWGLPILDSERREALSSEQAPDWEHADEWLPARWQRRRTASGSLWSPAIGRRAMLELLQAGPDSQWLHNAVANSPIDPLLGSITQPVLAICGKLDMLYHESADAPHLMPNARFAPLPGTGLDIADQHAELFVRTVADFLNACDLSSAKQPLRTSP